MDRQRLDIGRHARPQACGRTRGGGDGVGDSNCEESVGS